MERSWLHGLFQGTIHTFTVGTEEGNKTHRMSHWQSNWTRHRYSSQCVCTAVHFVANCVTAKCVVWCSELWGVVWCGVVICYWCFRWTSWCDNKPQECTSIKLCQLFTEFLQLHMQGVQSAEQHFSNNNTLISGFKSCHQGFRIPFSQLVRLR